MPKLTRCSESHEKASGDNGKSQIWLHYSHELERGDPRTRLAASTMLLGDIYEMITDPQRGVNIHMTMAVSQPPMPLGPHRAEQEQLKEGPSKCHEYSQTAMGIKANKRD